MLRAFSKLSLGLALTLSLAAACGSDDGKKQAKRDEDAAGQGGQEDIGAGGGKNHAGEPGALPGGAGGELPVVIVGGAGGESPVGVSGGAGGEAPIIISGPKRIAKLMRSAAYGGCSLFEKSSQFTALGGPCSS